ncbi:hypothetical protein [Streptomyces sp. NBC_00271]|uniref:hypothetical protein n=1 Tax=Streptomyces sp. NBC_00271 TaxID=2975697 RepID=UPI002E2AC675|nr:hypothetical protein [Streptomyces sp. NBC_00271]
MSEIPVNPEEVELLLYLGTMVRDAAHMEITVEALTGHLVASHDPQASGVRGQPLSSLVRTCRETARQVPRVDDSQLASLDKLLDRVTALSKLRNAYVHGGWAKDLDGSLIALRGKRGQSALVSHAVSGDQLVEMIDEIRSIYDGLMAWISHDLDIVYGPLQDQSGAES